MDKPSKSFTIKSWSMDDRPREKLMKFGKRSLSNAELVAILIGSGNRNETAVALSKRILAAINNDLSAFGKVSVPELMKFKGIGEAKAISIITALELGRRQLISMEVVPISIAGSKDVFVLMKPLVGDLNHEEFWVIFLNNSNKIIDKTQLSKGGLTGTLVDTRLLFKQAIGLLATGIILCHNHPSGKVNPSESDKILTRKIVDGGTTLDIKVLDHVIITEKTYFSFADEGLL
ncbi:MAG: DNA repair protein RadC [Flavobacteriaceae bacterium]|nr:DNA repair protein RadC [Flavobacteriaceae bacterium]